MIRPEVTSFEGQKVEEMGETYEFAWRVYFYPFSKEVFVSTEYASASMLFPDSCA